VNHQVPESAVADKKKAAIALAVASAATFAVASAATFAVAPHTPGASAVQQLAITAEAHGAGPALLAAVGLDDLAGGPPTHVQPGVCEVGNPCFCALCAAAAQKALSIPEEDRDSALRTELLKGGAKSP